VLPSTRRIPVALPVTFRPWMLVLVR
jgi:hypothetical protein